MSIDKMNSSEVYALFEEIKQILKEVKDKSGKNAENKTETLDFSGIEDCINQSNEQVSSSLERIECSIAQSVAQKIHHRVSIDIKASWVFLTIVGLSLFLVTSLALNYNLKQANDRLSDNDLKYRYVKMQAEATREDLIKLETVFSYNRNNDSISLVRKRVETFERLVKEQAEKMERARLNATEAEKLRKEVESVKNR